MGAESLGRQVTCGQFRSVGNELVTEKETHDKKSQETREEER